jgi:hypothetical protein
MITNPQALIDKLEKLPTQIYNQEKKTLDAKFKYELKEIEYDVNYSQELLKAQAPNATEKKAAAIVNVGKLRIEVLAANIEYERQKSYLKALENKFISLRKISSIEESLMKIGASGN